MNILSTRSGVTASAKLKRGSTAAVALFVSAALLAFGAQTANAEEPGGDNQIEDSLSLPGLRVMWPQ